MEGNNPNRQRMMDEGRRTMAVVNFAGESLTESHRGPSSPSCPGPFSPHCLAVLAFLNSINVHTYHTPSLQNLKFHGHLTRS